MRGALKSSDSEVIPISSHARHIDLKASDRNECLRLLLVITLRVILLPDIP